MAVLESRSPDLRLSRAADLYVRRPLSLPRAFPSVVDSGTYCGVSSRYSCVGSGGFTPRFPFTFSTSRLSISQRRPDASLALSRARRSFSKMHFERLRDIADDRDKLC